MKRLSLLLAAALLTAALAACGSSSSSSAAPSPTPDAASSEPALSDGGDDAQSGDTGSGGATLPEPDAELAKMLEDIYAAQDPGLAVSTVGIDTSDAAWFGYYTGLETADGIDAAVASEPMISAQAYSVVLLRAAEDADAAALAEQVLNSVDPVKWVCAQADDLRAVASGRYAMVVMMDSAFAQNITAEQLTAAFLQVVGGEASYESTLTVEPGTAPQGAVGTSDAAEGPDSTGSASGAADSAGASGSAAN